MALLVLGEFGEQPLDRADRGGEEALGGEVATEGAEFEAQVKGVPVRLGGVELVVELVEAALQGAGGVEVG